MEEVGSYPMHKEWSMLPVGVSRASLTPAQDQLSALDKISLFCMIGLAASAGAYIRVGFSYLQVWRIETSNTFQFFNVVGCFVMGFSTKHKKYFFDQNQSYLYKILYIAVTSGLCGSVTSFSTIQMECNKSFFLQWDNTWGNAFASSTGAKLFDWLLCLLSSVAVPTLAFHAGGHLRVYSPVIEAISYPSKERGMLMQKAIIGIWSIYLLVIVLVCGFLMPHYSYLVYTAVFSVIGAYSRYRMSVYNTTFPEFPMGTFAVNISGTWLLAIFTVISKFAVGYYDYQVQAVIYGLVFGLCGCLTTVSTFVKEIDELPVKASYKYGIMSTMVAQFGVILLYNTVAFVSIPKSTIYNSEINICHRSKQICGDFLMMANCSSDKIVNEPCSDMNDYATYDSDMCKCGSFASDHFSELLVDSQVKSNVNFLSVAVWPNKPLEIKDASTIYDVCLTYSHVCMDYMARIGCPDDLVTLNSCNHVGVMKGAWECTCGGHYTPGDRIQELLTDTYLFQRYDMIPYSGWPTLDFIDFEAAFESTCARILDHINCEKSDQTIRSTAVKGDFSTWDAACECGNSYNVNTVRVSEDLFDAITKPWIYGLLVRPNPALHVWDTCASYSNVCSHFLDKIQCPSEIQVINSCDSMDPLLNGSLEVFNGTCICGNFDDISFRPMEAIIDSLLGQSIYNEFWYIPQVHPLYTTVIGASPFKQFMHQIDA